MSKQLLQHCRNYLKRFHSTEDGGLHINLIARLNDEIEQPEPKPVAWVVEGANMIGGVSRYLSWTKSGVGVVSCPIKGSVAQPLYTKQQDQSARITELETALTMCRDVMLHFGVHTDKEHPDRLALAAAENALAGL